MILKSRLVDHFRSFESRTVITALLSLAIISFSAITTPAQWTAPDGQGNISSTNTGNVGIGTTSPVVKVQTVVNSPNTNNVNVQAADIGLAVGNSNSTANNLSVISFLNSSPAGQAQIGVVNIGSAATSGGHLFFNTRAAGGGFFERMRITSAGNLGIGTASVGSLGDSGVPVIAQIHGGSVYGLLALTSTNTNNWSEAGRITFASTAAGSADKRFAVIQSLSDGSSATTTNGSLVFYTNNAGTLAERMRINKTGNVGIGTANPGTPLEVSGSSPNVQSVVRNTLNTGQASLRTINDASFVGQIGVYGSAQTAYGAVGANNGYLYSNGSLVVMADLAGGVIKFATGGSAERVRIDSAGNMGIGKLPGSGNKLDVNGTINANGLIVNGASVTGSASDLSSGTLLAARMPALTGDVTSSAGTTVTALTGTGVSAGSYTNANITVDAKGRISAASNGSGGSTAFSNVTAGTNTVALVVGNGGSLGVSGTGSINATSLTNAANITSGTVPIARLGTGTSDSTKFLRGDNSWTAITSSQWTTSGSNIDYTAGNVGIGTSSLTPGYRLDVNGNTKVTGDINLTGTINARYQDLAEWVPSTQVLPAGTVVTLDPTQSNHVEASSKAYDTRVAGVISAQPGIALGEEGQGKVLVATTGRVKIKVDASHGPIQVGDLLVTSSVPGVAMKSKPIDVGGVEIHRPGTLIGKALEPLAKGQHEILVLLSLQ